MKVGDELLGLRLSDLEAGQEGIIIKVLGRGAFRKRITEMGFVKGKSIRVIKNAPLQDPVEYEILNYKVSLRRAEAQLVEVVKISDAFKPANGFSGTSDGDEIKRAVTEKSKTINIALVGNPNCGKTTLFNYASGSHERVGNYSGVTVDAKEAKMKQGGYTFRIADLPGTYSITEYSPEELFVRTHILEKMPDIVVNVIDGSNLERNLFLTTQLIDMNIKVVIALNMYDELEQNGAVIDYLAFGKLLGIPVIPTVASKNKGISELFSKLIEVYEDQDPVVRHIHINYGPEIEREIKSLQAEIKKNPDVATLFSTRYLAIKLLEDDKVSKEKLSQLPNASQIMNLQREALSRLEKEFNEPSETLITDAKYGFIDGALKETFIPEMKDKRTRKRELDDLLTNKWLGFPVFLFLMWIMFQTTFTIGAYPMAWIDQGVGALGNLVKSNLSDGALRDLLVDGIITGVGGVIIFLPNILILFFFISLMEDTGYMARASFIMDKLMHKIGLHGKSFIPLVMGFGCNVPAIMASRSLENKKDRILTMIITPFMSCSARLPVYIVIISAFFAENQGFVLFSIYLIGIIIAILVALVMKKMVFARQDVPFVMELPPYRVPSLRNTTRHMWYKGVQYLKKMGNVILVASILIWALGYYPRNINYSVNYDLAFSTIKNDITLNENEKNTGIVLLELKKEAEHQEKSYIGQLGHFIEPIIQPLGFDWKMGVSILTGLAAKEIVISTMGILYQAEFDAEGSSSSLSNKLKQQIHTSGFNKGKPVMNPLVAYGFMLFILIYFPCVAVIAAIRKESTWGWAVFTMTYTTAIAWLVAFITFQVGRLFL
jgi:ferrous iron transport protein B